MAEKQTISDILRPAFESFLEELGKDITFIKDLIDEPAFSKTDNVDLSAKISDLAQRFHRIKGGAGFLKLSICCDLANEAEKHYEALKEAVEKGEISRLTKDEQTHLKNVAETLQTEYSLLKDRLAS
jgi:HPt (histidine-containing phosphotransfer) domain-containing protein